MRVIIAARLSRKAKGQTGIDTQDVDARDWAEDNGHTIVATVADRKSGRADWKQRKNLSAWVTQDDHMALYDMIVAAKHDRLSRADWRDEADIRRWAEDNGKKLFLVDQNLQWPPRNADDRQRWDNAAEQSRREWENTSRRYSRMQRGLREGKYFVGKRSFGYRIVECDEHKTLEIDETEAGTVREIYSRYLKGESLTQIRAWITSTGIPAMQGNVWSSQAIRRILRNPVYTGRVMVHGETYLTVPHIIEPADFERTQEMLAGKATRGPQSKTPAMLTGVVQCDHGHKMYRLKGRSIPTVPDGLYYYCNAEKASKGERLLVPLTYAESVVNDVIMEVYGAEPHMIERMSPDRQYANRIAEIKMDIRELDPTADDFMEVVAGMRAEIKRLDALASKDAEPTRALDKKDDGTIRTIGEAWTSRDNAGKAKWLRENGWTVTVTKLAAPLAEGLPPFHVQVDPGFVAGTDALTALGGLDYPREVYAAYAEAVKEGE